MLANLLFTLAVAATSVAASALPSSRYLPSALPNRVYMSDYVELLDVNNYFVPSMEGYDTISRSDEYTDLLDNKLYVPYTLHINWNVNGYQIDDFECLVFDMNSATFPNANLGMVYGFYTTYANNVRTFGEYGGVPNSSTQTLLSHVIANTFTIGSAPSIDLFGGSLRRFWTFSSFTGSSLSIVINEFIDNLEAFYWNQVYLNGVPQSFIDRMTNNGYEEGFRAGKDAGYAEGKQDGLEASNNAQGILATLFGGIVSVPLDILNGMSTLVIWDVPIISIIFTFLVVAVLLLIIRKFI